MRPLFHALDLARPDWDALLDREEKARSRAQRLRTRLEASRREVARLEARVAELEAGTLRGEAKRALRLLRGSARRFASHVRSSRLSP